jgi:phage replication-related protein YjqB (UPF0714/DUF867 family)
MHLRDILDQPGVDEQCVLRSNVGFLALHGGSQDRGTDLIARRAAARAGASYYGIVQPPTMRVHLTSRRHDPADSHRLRMFLDHVVVAISVHGFGRDGFALALDPARGLIVEPYGPALKGAQRGPIRSIILGGLNAGLLRKATDLLTGRFEGYHVADDRVRLGFHPANPVNLPSGRGVQVELPPGLRGIGPLGDRPAPDPGDPVLDPLVDALVELALAAPDTVNPAVAAVPANP